MEPLVSRLRDREVIVRLNAFLLSYLGWMAFSLLYIYMGRKSVDITQEFLKLPLTSKPFVLALLEYTRSIVPLYLILKWVYYFGFAGSIAFMVFYVLIYLRDLEAADKLLARYLLAYAGAGIVYLIFHIYAPHYVYQIQGYPVKDTLLTRQEFVLPSLHNTFAAIHILTVWKYRKRLGGKAVIVINTLIPFSTVFLAHHWVYDVLTGFLLAGLVSRITDDTRLRIPERIHRLETKSLRAITMLNFTLAALVLIVALYPQKWLMVVRSLLGQP
ncbi:phosphoesterase [Thermococcus eurythermalis]|uniref:Phosphoesterase n=1 Tax=Thermococcus eurythermalis TaxID=1505907 RepID=A0A097QWE7_9EURY|nr:phosphatase PAP2 family protein [Thermococcus eurythermalis]AIU70793.1 phosphoesterase [Thermococcus eurythermalis]